jgi:hypothetical protein
MNILDVVPYPCSYGAPATVSEAVLLVFRGHLSKIHDNYIIELSFDQWVSLPIDLHHC